MTGHDVVHLLRGRARAPGRDPLLRTDFSYVEHTSLDHFSGADWQTLNAQRECFRQSQLATQVLRQLESQRHDPSFGYQVNNYHHSLQTATLMLEDGLPEEDVVLGLLHDIGFTVCPDTHAEYAACVLGPYLSERNLFVLRHHPVFQAHHIHDCDGIDREAREALRGHRWFEDCARFVERYDIVAIDPNIAVPPLRFFEPMVRRFFARPAGGDPGPDDDRRTDQPVAGAPLRDRV